MKDFHDPGGLTWRAEVITSGRTSAYLNPRVHRPIVQFTCLAVSKPRRYASLPDDAPPALDEWSERDLAALLDRARVH